MRGLQPGRTFAFLVQGCNWGLLGSGCSGWTGVDVTTPLPPPPLPTAPVLTASASSPSQIVLSWPVAEAERITRTVIERDGRPHVERGSALSRFDDAVRPNTEYGYRVCLTNQTGTACSPVVTAMAQAVAPTPLANVTFTRSAHSGAPGGGVSRASARITRVLKADWRNGGTPGQFVTLEREDRGPVDHIRVGKTWTEVKRISAKADPTEIWIEIGSASPQIGVRDGTNYRVCTIVPPLGPAGKVCSAPSAPNEQ